MNQNLKMISCIKCGGDMPELRKILYNYSFCTLCSDSKNLIKPKHGITVMNGEGDHTYIETIIMDNNQYKKYKKYYSTTKKIPLNDIEKDIINESEYLNSQSKEINDYNNLNLI